jgi:endonuclease-3
MIVYYLKLNNLLTKVKMTKKLPKYPKLATKSEILEIKEIFLKHYPNSVTELNYNNLYELLIAVMLSAQCTDKRVNIITPALFKKYPSIKELANANLDDVKELIKSCSFFNNKAKNLIAMAQMVLNDYNGQIPLNQKELVKLPGVGQKTANVILIEFTGANLMAVDTHVFRVAHRLGLSRAKTPKDTEADLVKKFKTNLHQLHQAMVLFGRYICTAKNPKCDKCILPHLCKSKESFKAK